MEFVMAESKCNKSIHVQQIFHGKFARISATSLLRNTGASVPALRTGSPVMGSVTILTWCGRFLRGVKTMRPASMLASSGSPARIPNRRRRGPGSTTCPLLDTLVSIVRQSYLPVRPSANEPPTTEGQALSELKVDEVAMAEKAKERDRVHACVVSQGAKRRPAPDPRDTRRVGYPPLDDK